MRSHEDGACRFDLRITLAPLTYLSESPSTSPASAHPPCARLLARTPQSRRTPLQLPMQMTRLSRRRAAVQARLWLRRHRARLWDALRMTTSVAVTFALGAALGLSQSFWA